MKKKLLLSLIALFGIMGGVKADAIGPFTFTSWGYNSYTRVGGTEGTATYVCNSPIYLEQKGVTIRNNGDLTISFQYTSGGKRLEIYGVELIGSESSYTAYEHKFAGSNGAQTYTLSNVDAGTYTLRIWSSEYGDGDSYLLGGATNGNITYSGDAASGANLTITSWSKDNWKKSGAAVPTQVSSTIKEKGWRSYDRIHYHDDENLTFSEAKSYNIHFDYTAPDGKGNQSLNIRGVEVLDTENNLVAYDYHEGFTGLQFSNRDYRLAILSPGTYTVRILVRVQTPTETPNDVQCQGKITYSVIDGSAIADNYRNNIKPNLYDNGVLKIGAPVQSVLTALETAIEGGDDIEIENAYNAAMTTNNLNLPTGYYYFHSLADDRSQPYLYNNYLLENNAQHHTLQSASKVTTNAGIWYVENNGTTINIKNGDGQPLVQGNQNQGNTGSVTVRNTLTFGNYNAPKFAEWGYKGIYFTEGLNAANVNTYSVNNNFDTRFVTTWANKPNEKDDNWTFEPVENLNIYNVVVRGADAYITLNNTNEYAFNGGFFNAENITEGDIETTDVDGYTSNVSINGNTITVTYVDNTLDMSESNQYIIKNPGANKYLAANLGSADEDGAEKFLKLSTGNKATVAEAEYDCFKLFSVGSLAYVGKSSADQNLTTEGAKKFGLVYDANEAVEFIYVGDDIIPVVNGTASAKAWNWHGGAKADNPVGLYTTGDGNSRWQFINIVDNAKVALNTAINNKSHIGNGLNQYAATEAYNNAIANGTAIYNSKTTTVAAVNEATTAINTAFASLQINQPAAGSFVRVRSVKAGMGYVNAEASTVHTNALKVGSKGTSSIYYYDGTHLLAYNNGQYLVKNDDGSGFLALGTVGTDGCTIAFEKTNAKIGAYAVNYANGRYLYAADNASNVDATGSVLDDKNTFWLEPVNELPIKINQVGGAGAYYGTINLPVAVTLPAGLKAYSAVSGKDENGDDVLNLTKVAGEDAATAVLAANTPVILYSKSNVESLSISNEAGAEASSNELEGTIAAKTVEANANYVLSGKNGIGFYKYTGATMPGFKAYLPASAASNVAAFRFSFDEIETAIRAIESENNNAEIYDLNGRRVQKAQKGLYIVNGKKVMFK